MAEPVPQLFTVSSVCVESYNVEIHYDNQPVLLCFSHTWTHTDGHNMVPITYQYLLAQSLLLIVLLWCCEVNQHTVQRCYFC